MSLPIPSIADAPRIIEYAPNNVAGPFPVPFPLFDGTGADLAITLDGVLVTNWTFTGEMVPDFYGSASCWVNGMVTFDAPVTGALVIAGRRRPRRVDQFAEGRGVPARDHNLEYNRLTAAQREIFDRTETIAAATADIIPEVTALKDQAQQAATDAGNAAAAAGDAADEAQQAAQLLTTQALPDGTDFDSLDQRGTYVFTSDLNAPLAGPTNRWIVEVVNDPVDADRVAQRAWLLVGGTRLEVASRRRLAGGDWEEWLVGAAQAVDITYDDSNAYPDAANVQEALEESANYTGYVENETTLQNFVYGLILGNWSGTADRVSFGVTISPGRCRGNGVTAARAVTWAKMLNGAWAKGFGAGGLDAGSVQPNATYHVHGIREGATSDLDFVLSTSATSPVVPAGWTRVQRLGSVMTDGSGNIRSFLQHGNEFRLRIAAGLTAYNAAGSRPTALLTCPLPIGVRVLGLFTATLACGSTPNPVLGGQMTLGDGNDSTALSEFRQWVVTGGNGGVTYFARDAMCRTNASAQIYLGIQNGDGSYGSSVVVRGWVDEGIPRIGA